MMKHPYRIVETFSLYFVFYLPNVTKQWATNSQNRTSALVSLQIKIENSSPLCKRISGTALGHLILIILINNDNNNNHNNNNKRRAPLIIWKKTMSWEKRHWKWIQDWYPRVKHMVNNSQSIIFPPQSLVFWSFHCKNKFPRGEKRKKWTAKEKEGRKERDCL